MVSLPQAHQATGSTPKIKDHKSCPPSPNFDSSILSLLILNDPSSIPASLEGEFKFPIWSPRFTLIWSHTQLCFPVPIQHACHCLAHPGLWAHCLFSLGYYSLAQPLGTFWARHRSSFSRRSSSSGSTRRLPCVMLSSQQADSSFQQQQESPLGPLGSHSPARCFPC